MNNDIRASMETELGKQVVDLRLATPEEVKECLAIRAKESSDPSHRTLSKIMIDEGVVTPRQINRLKTSIEESRKQQIPGYQIISKIGAGAMGTVFKARQVSLDRIVAIKVLPKRLSENADYVERFYKEGRAAAKLNHPNIVQAFDVGEAGGYHYFVMEYVEGRELYEDLSQGKTYSELEAIELVIQIAKALEHAHAQGLIHRDVKPRNIMITPDGTAKLADMGLARTAQDAQAAKAEAGRAYGTPYYISPEQIRGELDIDYRADIYSLGATLYHMITGRVPFKGDTPAGVMHMHLKESLVPPDHVNTELSAGIGEVVEVMMAKDRRRRYNSASDVLVDLEAIAAGEGPRLARKQIDANVLSGLAGDSSGKDTIELDAHGTSLAQQGSNANLIPVIIVLAAALAVSLLINIVLIAS